MESRDLKATQDLNKKITTMSKLNENTEKSVIDRNFTFIVAPASRNGEALDLTIKCKDNEGDFALDLSKKMNKETDQTIPNSKTPVKGK